MVNRGSTVIKSMKPSNSSDPQIGKVFVLALFFVDDLLTLAYELGLKICCFGLPAVHLALLSLFLKMQTAT